MPALTAVYDASVLYPAPLRDCLMHLALTDVFRAKWSETIHAEWTRSLLAKRPDLSREQLTRTRTLMNAHVRDCLVEGFEYLIEAVDLPDPEDRHVVAAAIHGRADVIVTKNLRHFPATSLVAYGLRAQHPDEFIGGLIDLAPSAVVRAARQHRQSLRNPAKSISEYLETLERQQLAATVACLRDFAPLL